jgi:hypothetical protein
VAATSSTPEQRAKDAQRKRKARARVKERAPQGSFYDFGAWLQARVAELPTLPHAWSVDLADEMGEGGEYDRLLRRYAAGEVTPKTNTAYRIGEGLRSLGHPWVYGIVAVHAAGALEDFYAFIGLMTSYAGMRRLVARLGLIIPLTSVLVEDGESDLIQLPSEILCDLASYAERFDKLWRARDRAISNLTDTPTPSWTLMARNRARNSTLPMPNLIRMVVEVANAKALSVADREMIIARLLRAWAVQNGFSEVVAVYDEAEMKPPNASDLVDTAAEKGITP